VPHTKEVRASGDSDDHRMPVDAIKEYGFAGLLMVRAYLGRVEKP
jgi:hypothetical protein